MKKIATATLLACIATAAFAENEWTPLFNGKDFSGWTFDVRDDAPPDAIFTVADGIVTVRGKGNNPGVMRTQGTYSNYELEFEWRWTGGKGNSGCLVHASTPREMAIWPKSIEVQLMAENAGDFWLIGETLEVEPGQIVLDKQGQPSRRRQNLTDGTEKPLGEWNRMRIVAKDKGLEVFVNGQLVNKGWNASVGAGAICLQAEGADIQFRGIRLRPVGP